MQDLSARISALRLARCGLARSQGGRATRPALHAALVAGLSPLPRLAYHSLRVPADGCAPPDTIPRQEEESGTTTSRTRRWYAVRFRVDIYILWVGGLMHHSVVV